MLPPLPAMGYEVRGTGMGPHDVYYTPAAYTAEQMQDYARAALAARQPVGKHGEGDEFLAGICVALQCVTAQDSGVLWAEIVRAVGVDDLLQYATFIEPEEWDLAGFSTYASIELGRRKPRSKASKQAKRPPAQAVDLGQEPMFYIQDTRQFVGNCPVWWAPNGVATSPGWMKLAATRSRKPSRRTAPATRISRGPVQRSMRSHALRSTSSTCALALSAWLSWP